MKKNIKSFPLSYLQAHRHIDMICPKNKNHAFKKATITGRTSYYCPFDQKREKNSLIKIMARRKI